MKKNISPRRVVIASNVKFGSQASGVLGPVGCTAAVDRPVRMNIYHLAWRNIRGGFRISLRSQRTHFI